VILLVIEAKNLASSLTSVTSSHSYSTMVLCTHKYILRRFWNWLRPQLLVLSGFWNGN